MQIVQRRRRLRPGRAASRIASTCFSFSDQSRIDAAIASSEAGRRSSGPGFSQSGTLSRFERGSSAVMRTNKKHFSSNVKRIYRGGRPESRRRAEQTGNPFVLRVLRVSFAPSAWKSLYPELSAQNCDSQVLRSSRKGRAAGRCKPKDDIHISAYTLIGAHHVERRNTRWTLPKTVLRCDPFETRRALGRGRAVTIASP